MKIEPILHQLFALLFQQPARLTDGRLVIHLMPGVFARLLEGMRALHYDGTKPSAQSLATMYPDDEEMITLAGQIGLMGEPELPMDKMIELLVVHYQREKLSAMCRKYYDASYDDKQNIDKLIASMRVDTFSIGTNLNLKSSTVKGGEMAGVKDMISWRQANPGMLRGPSTGFAKLDRCLNGLTPRYYVIGARPSVGKSAIIGNMQRSLCEDGVPSAVFELEMTGDEYRERLVSEVSGVSIGSYRQTLFTIDELKRMSAAQRKIASWPFWINDDPEQTMDQIEAEIIRLVVECGIRVVFLDYLQYITLPGKGDRWEEIGDNSRRFKSIVKKLQIPVVVAAQLKRVETKYSSKEGKTSHRAPELQDLRESGNIEQDADVVGLLDRDWIHDPANAQLIIGKQRGGPTHPGIKMIYNRDITQFKEAA
jgi:replicative DNA helicase